MAKELGEAGESAGKYFELSVKPPNRKHEEGSTGLTHVGFVILLKSKLRRASRQRCCVKADSRKPKLSIRRGRRAMGVVSCRPESFFQRLEGSSGLRLKGPKRMREEAVRALGGSNNSSTKGCNPVSSGSTRVHFFIS